MVDIKRVFLPSFDNSRPRLIITGKTGAGKSTLLNWTFDVDEKFSTSDSLFSHTAACQVEKLSI
jgi:ABC-type lipoprotein export system ATPase subunit